MDLVLFEPCVEVRERLDGPAEFFLDQVQKLPLAQFLLEKLVHAGYVGLVDARTALPLIAADELLQVAVQVPALDGQIPAFFEFDGPLVHDPFFANLVQVSHVAHGQPDYSKEEKGPGTMALT